MPWKEICTVELREALVSAMLAGEVGVADLCRRAGVSRKTAYKWRERYQALGRAGLADRSRARLTQPDAVSDDVLDAILSTRLEHPTWGVKKILPYLSRMDPGLELPCLSTASEILRRAGLTSPRKKARRRPGPHNKSQEADTPNATWTIDFKGQFRLGCRSLCYPLTVADRFSRYLLCVDAKPGTQLSGVVTSMKRLFAVYGLPQRIKSDNGSPFAGSGLARLSRLSVWFMSLGIEVEHITPGKPGENGRHERMHRTLKAETACPPAWSMRGQQRRFNGFREEYNEDRRTRRSANSRPRPCTSLRQACISATARNKTRIRDTGSDDACGPTARSGGEGNIAPSPNRSRAVWWGWSRPTRTSGRFTTARR